MNNNIKAKTGARIRIMQHLSPLVKQGVISYDKMNRLITIYLAGTSADAADFLRLSADSVESIADVAAVIAVADAIENDKKL